MATAAPFRMGITSAAADTPRLVDVTRAKLEAIQLLFTHWSTRQDGGVGKDQVVSGTYTHLRPHRVWEVRNPALKLRFKAAEALSDAKNSAHPTTCSPMYDVKKASRFEGVRVGFHGTNPGVFQSVVANGFDDGWAKPGMMGRGIYFGDDPMKADQYTTSDNGVHYIFVCAIARSCMLEYIFDKRDRPAMFSDGEKRVPASIPDSSDWYDGIKLTADPKFNAIRYNEAALFGHATGGLLPLYLVAYTRVGAERQISDV